MPSWAWWQQGSLGTGLGLVVAWQPRVAHCAHWQSSLGVLLHLARKGWGDGVSHAPPSLKLLERWGEQDGRVECQDWE